VNAKHVHFVGIGGIGLSAIARVLLARGVRVSGSDPAITPITEALTGAGAQIYQAHTAENISSDTDLVVITSAVGGDNPEVEAARARSIRVIKRRELLGELAEGYRTIAIAGSHGKTTTTALIGLMLADAGLDPTVIVGGIVPEFGSNARTGDGEYLVIEADEYDHAFLGLRPDIAVITNIDFDHPDIFPTRKDYRQAFADFAGRVRAEGTLIVCGDDDGASALATGLERMVVRYGIAEFNDWRAVGVRANAGAGNEFQVLKLGEGYGEVRTRIPGRHNVLNALGALAAAHHAGVAFGSARATLERFGGVQRRFQVRGHSRGVTMVDDYAHHPSEIRATLAAARERFGERELWAVFQPHTFSRTRALLDEFAHAFDAADHAIITEVYAAREHESLGVSGNDIVARMMHRDARFIPTLDEVVVFLSMQVAPGSVVISLGAGDVNQVGPRLAEIKNGERARS
jgi:UDP-N-acetylmuramate--alanine ligase